MVTLYRLFILSWYCGYALSGLGSLFAVLCPFGRCGVCAVSRTSCGALRAAVGSARPANPETCLFEFSCFNLLELVSVYPVILVILGFCCTRLCRLLLGLSLDGDGTFLVVGVALVVLQHAILVDVVRNHVSTLLLVQLIHAVGSLVEILRVPRGRAYRLDETVGLRCEGLARTVGGSTVFRHVGLLFI
jgi:hypothetical protein